MKGSRHWAWIVRAFLLLWLLGGAKSAERQTEQFRPFLFINFMKQFNLKTLVFLLFCIVSGRTMAYNCYVNGIVYDLNYTEKTALVTYMSSSYDNSTAYRGAYVIPNSIIYEGNTYKVTGIGKSAFKYCSGLTSIEIPNSVTQIGNSAFEGCHGLESINIPNSVTTIGESAFARCTGLTNITITLRSISPQIQLLQSVQMQ